MVPVVIHNALESQPKGATLFRPATIRVEVLPPVATDDWTPASVDRHVADVRAMFLRALGQEDAKDRPAGRGQAAKKTGRSAGRRSRK